ncbi:hypothetical protein LSAT2_003159, partial [Lamellibrachia satsuma]
MDDNLNVPARSMTRILMLFEEPAAGGTPWARTTEAFYNPKVTKVEIKIDGSLTSSIPRACVPTSDTA